MSSNNLNETTKNFLQSLKDFKEEQEYTPIIIKLTYNEETGIVDGYTMEDTEKPWIEITREQYNLGIQYKRLKVVDGKLVEILKVTTKKLPLVQGDRWYTTKENMLIIGKERGWDERGNN